MLGSESSFHPIELCVNQRISHQEKNAYVLRDCEMTVKIAPVLQSSFSGFLQDLIRLKKNR